MSIRALSRRLERLEARSRSHGAQGTGLLAQLAAAPAAVLRLAHLSPDPWQEQLLSSTALRILLLASRQAGKSSVAAALALHTALVQPPATVLVLSPSLRQSGELFRKVVDLFSALGRPMSIAAESALRLELSNGSRIVSLPGDEKNIRGYSGVALLIIDEAARVEDTLYYAVRPMLAVSRGRLVALSTPFGKRGWFYEAWCGDGAWQRLRIEASQCPRIRADFLSEEEQALGTRWFRQEYLCSFEEVADAVFAYADVQAALSGDVQPLFDGARQ